MSKIRRYIARRGLGARKAIWRLSHDFSPNARPVFILGAQRSGTTLLLHCLNQSMEIEVLGEISRAMTDFRIVDDNKLKRIINSSRHKNIVLKPLTDSHRARSFLNLVPNGLAIWAFRRAEDRANSSVAKFGEHNLQILRGFANGKYLDMWQAQGLSDKNLKLIRSFDFDKMTPHSASGLFWYIRNSLFFENGLDQASDVLPLAYEDLVKDPAGVIKEICNYMGCNYADKMVRDVHSKSVGKEQPMLSDPIGPICAELYDKMHEAQKRRWLDLGF